jgi:hypothetical protein
MESKDRDWDLENMGTLSLEESTKIDWGLTRNATKRRRRGSDELMLEEKRKEDKAPSKEQPRKLAITIQAKSALPEWARPSAVSKLAKTIGGEAEQNFNTINHALERAEFVNNLNQIVEDPVTNAFVTAMTNEVGEVVEAPMVTQVVLTGEGTKIEELRSHRDLLDFQMNQRMMAARTFELVDIEEKALPKGQIIFHFNDDDIAKEFEDLVKEEFGSQLDIERSMVFGEVSPSVAEDKKVIALYFGPNLSPKIFEHAITQRGGKCTKVEAATGLDSRPIYFITLDPSTELSKILEQPVYRIAGRVGCFEEANKASSPKMLQIRNIPNPDKRAIENFLHKKGITFEFISIPRNAKGEPKKARESKNGAEVWEFFAYIYFRSMEHRQSALLKMAGSVNMRLQVYKKEPYGSQRKLTERGTL